MQLRGVGLYRPFNRRWYDEAKHGQINKAVGSCLGKAENLNFSSSLTRRFSKNFKNCATLMQTF